MATNVFVSFRASDGLGYKEELDKIFKEDISVRNYSENEDRSNMSESTIQSYLYAKLKETSLTIIILTPCCITNLRHFALKSKTESEGVSSI